MSGGIGRARRSLRAKSRLCGACIVFSLSEVDLGNQEGARERFQFGTVHGGEAREQRFAGFFEMHFDLTAIRFARPAFHEAERLAARDQRNDAVVLRLQAFREFAAVSYTHLTLPTM